MTNIQNLKTIEQKIGVTRNYQTPKIQMQVGLSWQHESKQPSGGINQINEALVLDWRWRRQVVDDPFFIRRGDVTEIRIGGGVQSLLSDQNFLRTYARHQTWWPVGARDTFFFVRKSVIPSPIHVLAFRKNICFAPGVFNRFVAMISKASVNEKAMPWWVR